MNNFFKGFNLSEIITVSLTLFAVIDILGSIPIVINLRKTHGHVKSEKASIYAGLLMILFLYTGQSLLGYLGIDLYSFAVAGSIMIFLIGMEMILGRNIFKPDMDFSDATVVPLAFPLIAGAGTLTTLLSVKADFRDINILIAIILNILFVYAVLKSIPFIERKLGSGGISVLRRIFGIILLAISIKIFKANFFSFQ